MSVISKNSIRFVSVNIERNLHYSTIFPFLKNFGPEVLCLQELLECDIALFERGLGMKCLFAPMTEVPTVISDKVKPSFDMRSPITRFGPAIFSTLPVIDSHVHYYVGNQETVPAFFIDDQTGAITSNKVLLSAEVSLGGIPYTFATTHFTWSNHGATSDEQRADLKKLFAILDTMPEFVLAGDFNTPRGREIFGAIAARYTDNIPVHYMTSIDKSLHRAGDLEFMVDGLFSTPEYTVTNVKLTDKVSDHMAVTALISKG